MNWRKPAADCYFDPRHITSFFYIKSLAYCFPDNIILEKLCNFPRFGNVCCDREHQLLVSFLKLLQRTSILIMKNVSLFMLFQSTSFYSGHIASGHITNGHIPDRHFTDQANTRRTFARLNISSEKIPRPDIYVTCLLPSRRINNRHFGNTSPPVISLDIKRTNKALFI